MNAAQMTAHDHAEPGTRAPARLLGELQGHAVSGDDVVAADHALLFDTEDLLEIHGPERHEGGGGIGGRPAELGVEGGHEALAQIAVGGGGRGDTGPAALVQEAIPERKTTRPNSSHIASSSAGFWT